MCHRDSGKAREEAKNVDVGRNNFFSESQSGNGTGSIIPKTGYPL